MGAIGRLCVLMCALAAVLPVSAAQAKITPVPKPPGMAVKPGAVRGTALIAPLTRPSAHRAVAPARGHAASTRRAVARTTLAARRRLALASSHGGRERAWRVHSAGGRHAPAVPPIRPTPLAFVGAGEAPVADRVVPWPVWKVALLMLLAVAEALVLAGVVRRSRFARAGELV
jgi:hypothetical protein